ncbi:hypothetical protein KLQ07_003188 [Salmonella enterica]|nr:hypothetical protein [Salmonella enterica]EHO5106387.1 hypothetical protein [Salmonella enterica]EHO5923041.1 hypothetical protein [Salmonella enterica]
MDAIPWGAATPTAVPSLVAGTVIGGAVLDAALAGFEADVAVPEPTDGAWPKWAGWAVVIAAAAAFTYLTCASGDDSTEDSEDSDAGDGEKGDSTDSGHGVSDGDGGEDDQLPKTRSELAKDLESKGFVSKGTSPEGYETWVGPDGAKVTIKPSGEVIRTQRVWTSDGSKKYSERQDYNGNRLPGQPHSTGHYIDLDK